MTTQISTIIREAERLDNKSLDILIEDVISIRTKRLHQQKEEALLLEKINKGLSVRQAERLNELNKKRQIKTLAKDEFDELTALIEKIEKLNVIRLKYITALARLRGAPVRTVMADIGFKPTINE